MSVEQAKPNGSSGKVGSTALESAAKQAEVVKLRLAGHSLDEIATRVGLAGRSGAHYHVTAWVRSLQSSCELAEEYRQTPLSRAEERYRRFRTLGMGEIDEQTGERKREPDWQAVNALQRDKRARGADARRRPGRRPGPGVQGCDRSVTHSGSLWRGKGGVPPAVAMTGSSASAGSS